MTFPPLRCQWDGDALLPVGPSARVANRELVVGALYDMVEQQQRSPKAHRAYFASLNEAWANLPEDLAEKHPTAEHLRKFALIMTGYHDVRSIVTASRAEAVRVAAFIRPMDAFSVVVTEGASVHVMTAQSQSMRAMGKQKFHESADAVLAYVAEMARTTPEALRKNVREAA